MHQSLNRNGIIGIIIKIKEIAMSREQVGREPEQSPVANTDSDNFKDKVEAPALTTTFLFQGASTLCQTNPNMSPAERAKYFRQMAERVAQDLEQNKIY
jgi:hypothetical protein